MADSLNRRDIDMIFRAETDSATRSVGELRKSVTGLRKDLSDQIAAAERGEASLEDLAKTTRDLKQAQDELGTARSLLTQLNTLTGGLEKSEARAEKLRQELAKLKAEEAAAESPTKRLTNSIRSKEAALSAATEKVARDSAALAEYKQQVEGIIGPVDNLEGSFREVAKISKDTAQGLAISGQAADTFAEKIKGAATAADSLEAFNQFGRDAGLLQQDIDYLAQFEDRIERVTAARNAQIAADLRFQDALEQTKIKQDRLAQTNAFRQVAAEARQAFTDVSRFGVATETGEASMRRLADAVADLADPARAASRDLSQVGDRVDEIADRLDAGGRRRTGELSQDLNDLEQALAALQRQAKQIDGLREQQQAAGAAEAAFESAKAEVFQLADALEAAGADATDDMTRALSQAQTKAEAAGVAFQREATKLKQLENAAEAASIDIKNLDAAEERLIATSTRAGQGAEKLRRSLGGGRGGGGGFLGLKPYELQNLSFQINDIFVGLASGQNPLIVLTQQGSQIAQLFPGVWGALAAGIPVIAAVAAVLVPLGLGLARAAEQAKELREVNAALEQSGRAGELSAEGVVQAIDALDDLGASGDDARAAILQLVKEGMDPKFFQDFGTAALNFAEITGEELPAATERLLEGLTRGKDAVLALDDEFQFLSDSEREQIRAMDDSTDAAEIRTIAFDAFYRKAQDVNAELRGPGVDASNALSNAWDDLLDTLAITDAWEGILSYIDRIKLGIAAMVNFISAAIRQIRNSFGQLAENIRRDGFFAGLGSINEIIANEKSFSELLDEAVNTTAGQVLAGRQGDRTSSGDVGAGTRGSRRTRESVLDRRQSRGRSGTTEAERLAEQLERDQERLQRALEQMTAKAITFQAQTIEQQLGAAAQAIENEYAALYRQLDEFAEQFPNATIGGLTQAEYRAQLDANKLLLTQRAQLAVYEQGINDLMAERTRRLAQIEERQDAGLITAEEAYRRALEVTSELNPRIEAAAQSAREFALAIGGANPSPELREFLAKLDGVEITLSETQSDTRNAALANLNQMEQRRNEIIERRNALIAANAQLVELGLMTEADARDQAAQAFARERTELLQLIEAERAFLALLLSEGVITQSMYDARLAQLQAIEAQTEYVDDRILQVNAAAQQAFVQGFGQMFHALASGIADVLTQSGSVVDLFENLGRAALQFAADFLKAIADVIIQMLALQALKAIFGASTGGLGALFFHGGGTVGGGGGQMRRTGLSFSPLAVAAAPRYHNGTPGVGLRRDEQLSVLKRGEKVVTEEQDRLENNRLDALRKSGGGDKLRQVLAFGDDEIAGAMAGPSGERTTITHIRRNIPLLKQLLR